MDIVKSDAQIQKDVLEEFLWDTRVGPTEVGVEVDNGVVTLTGTVDSYAKKAAAREAAHRVAGVLDVADDVRVNLPASGRYTDTEVAEAVRRALTWDALVPEERIRSTVSDGYVTLDGEVERWTQRLDAENAIRNLQGVRGVVDHIRVVPSAAPEVKARAVRTAIEKALERRSEREAKRIDVDVEDGAVVLSGKVQNWAEAAAIAGAAAHTPGITAIRNNLKIDPSLR